MRFWQISRCSVCQSSDFFAQGPRITEKKYNFFKTTVFSAKICFCGQVNCCLVKKSAEKLSTEKQNFYAQASEELFATSKTDENINGKHQKLCFLKRLLSTTRKQCQRPCQKFFSQIQNFRSKSAKDEKSRKCFSGHFFSHRRQPCQKFSCRK